MAKIEIKDESLPSRCEICHQSDLYDATNNYCSRCANVKVEQSLNSKPLNLDLDSKTHKKAIDKLKWILIFNSATAIITHFIIETMFVDFHITPIEKSPFLLSLLFRLSLLLTFIFGITSLNRWYTIIAWLTIGFIICSISGR
jgi:hypothetical protein